MLSYSEVTDSGVSIEQVTNRPSLYLDQWMWGMLSQDPMLRQSFIHIGRKVNATVMYSCATLTELGLIENKSQIDAIAEVMDSLDYGFSDANPSRVIRRERELEVPEGGSFRVQNPCCDVELMENYALNVMNPFRPFTASELLRKVKDEGPSGSYKRFSG